MKYKNHGPSLANTLGTLYIVGPRTIVKMNLLEILNKCLVYL